MNGLIWQDDENIIDVVYQTIYGLPVKEALHVVELYEAKQLIPIEWILKWADKNCMYCLDYDYPTEKYDGWYDINNMLKDWEKENERMDNR